MKLKKLIDRTLDAAIDLGGVAVLMVLGASFFGVLTYVETNSEQAAKEAALIGAIGGAASGAALATYIWLQTKKEDEAAFQDDVKTLQERISQLRGKGELPHDQ